MIDFKQEIFLMSPYHVIAALGMTKVLENEKKNYLWEQNEKQKLPLRTRILTVLTTVFFAQNTQKRAKIWRTRVFSVLSSEKKRLQERLLCPGQYTLEGHKYFEKR